MAGLVPRRWIPAILFVALAALGVWVSQLPPEVDFEALCEQRCACERCDPLECVEDERERLEKARECREAYVAFSRCKLEPGNAKCERAGDLAGWMPVGCDRELQAYSGCLGRVRDRDDASAQARRAAMIPKGETLADDLRMVCNAPNQLSAEAKADPSQRAVELARYVEPRIGTDEARQLFEDMATMSPDEKLARLRRAIQAVGIEDCAFLAAMQ